MSFFLPSLLALSFVGTKFVGLESTIHLFERLGRWQLRWVSQGPPTPILSLLNTIEKSYRLVPFPIRCLDQAVVKWFILNLHGYPGSLKIGVTITPLQSHAWVCVDGDPIEDEWFLSDYSVVAEFHPWQKPLNEGRP
jgi:hypothetical protein